MTEMPGSRTVHLLLIQLHNAVYYYFLNFTFIIFSETEMMMMMMMIFFFTAAKKASFTGKQNTIDSGMAND